MDIGFTAGARRLGLGASITTAVLIVVYASDLVVGLLSLASPDAPIDDPMFTILEVLILALMPAMVCLMIALHAWASPASRALTLAAAILMAMVAVVTCCVHFAVLTLSRAPAFASQPWAPLLFSFRWPSVAYALDILAWDVFFPLSMFLAAPALHGSRLARWIRGLMFASGVLALAGLSGVVTGDMQLRNIGILGYVGAFLVVAVLLGVLFYRASPEERESRACDSPSTSRS